MRIPFRRRPRVTPPPAPLGNWRIAPTYLVERRRKRPYQVALLFPPSGFTGRARLSVIGAEERIEFTGAWSASGHPADWDPDDAERFGGWLTRSLATSGLGPQREEASDEARPWPLPFRLPQERGARRLTADLLLETAFDGDTPQRKATTPITLPLVPPTSRVYLTILLSPPGTELPGEVLEAAVREARRRKEVRFGWAGRVPQEHESWTGKLRRLAAYGQFEQVASGEGEPARVQIDWSPADPASLPAPYEGALARPVPGEPDLIAAQQLDDRLRVLFRPAQILPFNPLLEGREALAAVYFHHVLVQGGARARFERGKRGVPGYHGFAVARWDEAAEWYDAAKALARWNRSHGSPEILMATPSDMLTAIEELHRLGRVRSG